MIRKGFGRWLVKAKKNKYGAVKTVVDGKTCDSKLEGKHYAESLLRERAGEISNLQHKPKWDACVNGVKIGVIELDQSFYDIGLMKTIYVDSKGKDTPLSKWKRKHLKAEHDIDVELWRA